MEQDLISHSNLIGDSLRNLGYTISTAESCTGGLLSHVLTAVSGSSDYFVGGVVAYSNAIKAQVLGVQNKTLQSYGAVSEQTAREMADGIRENFGTDIGLSTTGVAGPTGGTLSKPVGLVWMGLSLKDETHAFEGHFSGGRLEIMHSTVIEILTHLIDILTKSG